MISADRARSMKVEQAAEQVGEFKEKVAAGIKRALKKLSVAIQAKAPTGNSLEVRFAGPVTQGEQAVFDGIMAELRAAHYEVMVSQVQLKTGIGILDALASAVGVSTAYDVTISW